MRSSQSGEAVTIFGDYDVDGATSAALMILLLRDLGLEAKPYIPDRLMEGYGPSGEALVRLKAEGASLIVTVDCGAQAFDALEQARVAGVDVIVVDHHKCALALPHAHALVNPNRLDETEGAAHGHLAAVGVAFLLGAALIRTLKRARLFRDRREPPRLLDLLDIVALGTVADVAQLKGLNRAFVSQGLKVMAQRRNIGLNALISASRLTRAPTATDLGYALGPRINAGGRVGKSDLGVRLLTTRDPQEAADIAAELDRLNEERRAIEALVQEGAEALALNKSNRAVIVVAGRGWHPGVIGIVAGRLKEKYGRPAIVIAVDEHGVGKGSGRSISGVDLGAAVLSAKDSGLLVAGGGHAMAAGLTIDARPARRVRRIPRIAPRRCGYAIDRRPCAVARCAARAGRHHTGPGRGDGPWRALRHGLAPAARGGRAGPHHQGGYRRQRPCPRGRRGR
jgi:single-stranded-DNA-specific exonuclease